MKQLSSLVILGLLAGCGYEPSSRNAQPVVPVNAINQTVNQINPVLVSLAGIIPVAPARPALTSQPITGEAAYGADWDTTLLAYDDITSAPMAIHAFISRRLDAKIDGTPVNQIQSILDNFCVAGVLAGTSQLDGVFYPPNTPNGGTAVPLTTAVIAQVQTICSIDLTAHLGWTYTIVFEDVVIPTGSHDFAEPEFDKHITLSKQPPVSSRSVDATPYNFYLKRTSTAIHFASNPQNPSNVPGSEYRFLADTNTTSKITRIEYVTRSNSRSHGTRVTGYRMYFDRANNVGHILADDRYRLSGYQPNAPSSINRFYLTGRPLSAHNKTSVSTMFRTAVDNGTIKLRNACIDVATGVIASDGQLCTSSTTEIDGVSLAGAAHMGFDIAIAMAARKCDLVYPDVTALNFDATTIDTADWCVDPKDTTGPLIIGHTGDQSWTLGGDPSTTSLNFETNEAIKPSSVTPDDFVITDVTHNTVGCATIPYILVNNSSINMNFDLSACSVGDVFTVTLNPANITDISKNPGTGDPIVMRVTIISDTPAPTVVSTNPPAGNVTTSFNSPFEFVITMSSRIDGIGAGPLTTDSTCASVGSPTQSGTNNEIIHFPIHSACHNGDTFTFTFHPSAVSSGSTPGSGPDVVWPFTVDLAGPTISSSSPATGALVAAQSQFQITFNEAIAASSVNMGEFTTVGATPTCGTVTAVALDPNDAKVVVANVTASGCDSTTNLTYSFDANQVADLYGNAGTSGTQTWTYVASP